MKVEVTRERLAFGLTILGIIIGGAVAWGDLKARVGKIDKLEDLPAKVASVQTDLGNIRGDISSLRNLSNTVAGLDKTVASLNDTVKRFEATNLPATVASLDATVTGLKNAVDRLEARQEKSASKEDIARIEGELKDLQRMLIQKGVARTSKLPGLEDALGGVPSLEVSDPVSRQIFFIVPEDQYKAEDLLTRWSRQAPVERQKFTREYFSPIQAGDPHLGSLS